MSTGSDAEFAELERTVADLRRELAATRCAHAERIAQQAATMDVLQAMSDSPGDAQPVFDAIARRAKEFCQADGAAVVLLHDGQLHLRGYTGFSGTSGQVYEAAFPRPVDNTTMVGRAIIASDAVFNPDIMADPDYELKNVGAASSIRSSAAVPLSRDGVPIGAVTLGRFTLGGFSDAQMELLRTFAQQAVIAITSAETYHALQTRTASLRDSLEQQTATAEVLGVINASPGDLAPVFEAILEKAHALCEAEIGTLTSYDGEFMRAVAVRGLSAEHATLVTEPYRPSPGGGVQKLIDGARFSQMPDMQADHVLGFSETFATRTGLRTYLGIPLRKDGAFLGQISAYRREVRPFTEKEIALLENFAAQAVIAIENARLLGELRERTAELAERNTAFAERIDHQAATIDVLKAMSASPGDPQPVFDLIVRQAREQCSGEVASLFEFDGTMIYCRALISETWSREQVEAYRRQFPTPLTGGSLAPSSAIRTAIREQRIVHIRDAHAGDERISEGARRLGLQSGVMVPLIRDGRAAGAIVLSSKEAGGCSDTQVELLKTFAEQAVIAITSAETYRALQDRTVDLQESLEYQTAVSDVLRVISRSRFELQPVLETLLATATRLCTAQAGVVVLRDGEMLELRAAYDSTGKNEAFEQAVVGLKFHISDRKIASWSVRERTALHLHDPLRDPRFDFPASVRLAPHGTTLVLPLMRDGEAIGTIHLARERIEPFSEPEISLANTFADQAVIAIENTRLLTEQREALEQQTATAEVLGVINASPGDLTPVFEAILEKAHRICHFDHGALALFDGTHFHAVATRGYGESGDAWSREPYLPSGAQRLVLRGARYGHIPDISAFTADPDDTKFTGFVALTGFRATLLVPLRKDGAVVGHLSGWRLEPGPFSDKEIALLENFAAQAVIAMENARLLTETREALEQQTATAELLQTINESSGNLQPLFDAMLEKATLLCGVAFGFLCTWDGQVRHIVAARGFPPALTEYATARAASTPSPGVLRVLETKRPHQILDLMADDGYRNGHPDSRAVVELGGVRTCLHIPLVKDDTAIGHFTCYHRDVQEFSSKDIALLENFAAQAVIAMENARLLTEQREALEQQTATAEVLQVINASPGDLAPVFQTMLDRALRLCGAAFGELARIDDEITTTVAISGMPAAFSQVRVGSQLRPGPGTTAWRIRHGENIVHVADLVDTEAYRDGDPVRRTLVDDGGARALLAVPLRKDDALLGLLSIFRQEPGPFSEKQVALLENFAAQAVIAMENARLLTEQREALERQTAMAEVLQVINANPGNLMPVFDAIMERSLRLGGAVFGALYTYDGERFHMAAIKGVPPEFEDYRRRHPQPTGADSPPGQLLATRRPVQVVDNMTHPFFAANPHERDAQITLGGVRAVLALPLLKDGAVVGQLVIYRKDPGIFPDKQVAVLENFAAQAVIAMENARLLTEQREALERQTAMAEVLQVINANPGNLTPVFDVILAKAHTVCGADMGTLFLWDGTFTRGVATLNYPDDVKEMLGRPRPRGPITNRLIAGERYFHIHDVLRRSAEMDQLIGQGYTERSGVRSNLTVPLRRDGAYLGHITANRKEVRPYSDSEISLLESFAAQAVIAMDNARLLNEIRQRQSELDITFENMGDGVAMFDRDQKLAAWNRNFQDILDLPDGAVRVGLPLADYIRGLAERGEYGPDANADEQIARLTALVDQANRFERERPNGHVIDIRQNPIPDGGFVIIYADITERKRAEEALRVARDEAETALRELKLAQANLVQAEKMASLGQLTAGIAHEIKNPLNFVNNFAALSVDLLDELKETAAPAFAALDGDARADVEDLTETLTGNLRKIEEHGRRADGIVKAMLEHSRGESGERRSVDINALADEALNLAYHGARAQDQSFNITLERDFGDGIAPIEVNPQDITRVLLNLLSNGFYAANKRARSGADGAFRPTLKLTTRGVGDAAEIRVRDNGTGIPANIGDKLFQPFFTTKPTGEGTGLGLSITYDIVTKAHGGTISVDSAIDEFTEFVVTLPRRMFASGGSPG